MSHLRPGIWVSQVVRTRLWRSAAKAGRKSNPDFTTWPVYPEMCTDCRDFCLGSSALSVPAQRCLGEQRVGSAGTQLQVWETNLNIGGQDLRVLGEHAGGPWAGRAPQITVISFADTCFRCREKHSCAREALCVEVLKTSAGLGLVWMEGSHPCLEMGLTVKRVYKGNLPETPVLSPVPVFSMCMSVLSIWKSNLFKNFTMFLMLTSRVYCISSVAGISTRVAHPHDSYIAWYCSHPCFTKEETEPPGSYTDALGPRISANPAWTQAVCSSVCASSLKAVSLTPCSCLRVLTYH